MAQGGPKAAPRWPKLAPRWPKMVPRWQRRMAVGGSLRHAHRQRARQRWRAMDLRGRQAAFLGVLDAGFACRGRAPPAPQGAPLVANRLPSVETLSTVCCKKNEEGAKTAQDGPKMAQDGPKMAQDGPKTAKGGPRSTPRRAKMGPKTAEDGPRRPQDGPRRAQDVPRSRKIGQDRRR